jgi:hypothetical protein
MTRSMWSPRNSIAVSRTDLNFEGFSWLHNVDAALCHDAPVEESVAGPIREFDETETFLGTEPFYNTTDSGPEGGSNRAWLNRGQVPKARGCGW